MLFSSWLRNSNTLRSLRRSGARKRPLANGPASARGPKRWKTALCSAATSKPIWWATSPALRTSPTPT